VSICTETRRLAEIGECNGNLVHVSLQVEDLIYMQHANVMNLPENYNMKYCMHLLSQSSSLDCLADGQRCFQTYTMLLHGHNSRT